MKKKIIIITALFIGLAVFVSACKLFLKKPELEVELTIELSADYIITSLAKDKNHPLLANTIALANEYKSNQSESYIKLFGKAFEKANPDKSLAELLRIAGLTENASNQEIIEALQEELNYRVEETIGILEKRIDRFGLRNQNIQQISNTERILIELPKIDNIERVKELIQTRALLGFWETYDNQEIFQYIEEVNEQLKVLLTNGEIYLNGEPFQPASYVMDTTSLVEAEWSQKFPLFSVLTPRVNQQGQLVPGPCIGNAFKKDTSTVASLFRLPQIKKLLPDNLKLAWTAKPAPWDATNRIHELIALRVNNKTCTPPLDGTYITKALTETDSQGEAYITITKNAEGAKKWQRLTANNIGRSIAITLDNRVYSYPQVNAEITGGRSSISGDFNIQEAEDLANILEAKPLPAPVSIINISNKNNSLEQN
ncbi:MAG: SecDF P1 head subdomain-containing protein [Bacteroidales bacterium]